jgi:hypothetical protein
MIMIFGNHAVNLDMVTRLLEEPPGTVRFHFGSSSLAINGVTIDQVLTAQAAGQARVLLNCTAHVSPSPQRQTNFEILRLDDGLTKHFDDGSKRGNACGNDPQALKSIGRGSRDVP